MANKPLKLSQTRVLVSNDDGINAPGLKVLEKVMRSLGCEVWVVAPETEQSAASHSLTLRLPLRIRALPHNRFAVNGTPTDCVLLGINEIMKDAPPDLVVSGVNRGGNMGEDVTYSGTVAAAMEGTLLGVPSLALSQLWDHGHPVKWATAEKWAAKVIKKLTAEASVFPWPPGWLMTGHCPHFAPGTVSGTGRHRQRRRL